MPKTPIDYSKTIIYRIVCKDPTIKECYVGSTTDFTRRKKAHKDVCNNDKSRDYNHNIYQFIIKNGGWNNFDMIEVEKYNAIDHLDQLKRERYWLEFYQATLNKIIPSRTIPEYRKTYREENKEYFTKYNKEYWQINKEKIKENNRENNTEKITCECGAICLKYGLARHKTTKKHLTFASNAINVSDSSSHISSIGNELKTEGF